MDPRPDDLTGSDDPTLLRAARAGDRLAFGVLYLRHHAAAWRVACVASRFSADAELAVIDGFTRVFSALPEESEDLSAGRVTLRPYVLACVRQAALDRARAAGRPEGRPKAASDATPAGLAGLTPDGEVVLSSLEHHVVRGALAALPERSRTALWLSEVEALTPAELAGVLGGQPGQVAALAAGARGEVRAAQVASAGDHEARAACRFTVEHLEAYDAGRLTPDDRLAVRNHLDRCPTCRMRHSELANFPAALAAAVPAAPLLGGEAQQHWLASVAAIRPADRLLPPGRAAAETGVRPAPARARDWSTGRLPILARQASRAAKPAVVPVALVVAWLAIMLAVPRLMSPATAPGPDGLALPVVQGYVPGFLPGAAFSSGPAGRLSPAGSRFTGAAGTQAGMAPGVGDGPAGVGAGAADATLVRSVAGSVHSAPHRPWIRPVPTVVSRSRGPTPALLVPVAVTATPPAPVAPLTPAPGSVVPVMPPPTAPVPPSSPERPGKAHHPKKANPGRENDVARAPIVTA